MQKQHAAIGAEPGLSGVELAASKARKERHQFTSLNAKRSPTTSAVHAQPPPGDRTPASPAQVNELIKANNAMRAGLARLAAAGDIDGLLDFFAREALEVTAANAAYVLTCNGLGSELNCRALAVAGDAVSDWRSLDWVLQFPSVSAIYPTGIIDTVVREDGIYFHLLDAPELAARFPALAEWHHSYGHRLTWTLAISIGNRGLGALSLAFRKPVKPSVVVGEILQALIQQVALALEVTRLAAEARDAELIRERERAVREQVRNLTRANDALRATSDTLAATDSLDQFFETVVKQIIEVCNAAAGAVNLPTEDEGFIEIIAPFERNVEDGQLVPITDVVRSMPLTGFVRSLWEEIKTTHEYRWNSLDQPEFPEDKRRHHDGRGHRHDVHIPIRLRGVTLGYMGLAFTSEEKPNEAQLQVVRVLVQQVALAIGLSRLMETAKATALVHEHEQVVRNHIAHLTQANDALRAASEKLAATDSLEQFLETIVRHSVALCGADAGAINAPSEDGSALEVFSPIEKDKETGELVPITDIEWTRPLTGAVLKIWEEIKAAHDYRWETWDHLELPEDVRRYHANRGRRYVAEVPIRLHGVTFGYLALAFGSQILPQEEPGEARLQIVSMLAQQAALAIEMKRLGEKAHQAAIAKEREQAQIERVAELVKTNCAMRASSEQLVALDRLDDYLETVVRAAAEACGAVAGSIGLPSEDGESLQIIMTIDDSGPAGTFVPVSLSDRNIPLTPETRQMWEGIRASDCWWATPDQPGFPMKLRRYHAARGHSQIARLPIRLRGETLGYLGLAFRGAEQPNQARLELSSVFVQQAALAIGMTRLAEEARHTAVTRERESAAQERLADLQRANEAMSACSEQLVALDNLQNFFDTVIRTSVVVCGAAGGSIGVMNSDQTAIQGAADIDDSGENGALVVPVDFDRRVPMTPAAKIAWAAIQSTSGCWWTTPDNPAYTDDYRRWHKRRRHHQVGFFPIRLHGATLGFLALSYRQHERPTEVQLAISRVLAQQAALAIGMTQLAEETRFAAVTRERAAQLDAANEAIRRSIERTAAEDSISVVLCSIVEEAVRLVGATGGLISAIQASEGHPFHPVAIWLHGRRVSEEEWAETSGVASVGARSAEDPTGFFGRIRQGDEVILPVDRADPLWWPDALAFMVRIGAKLCLSLPVRSRGAVVGMLKLWLPYDEAPSPELLAHLRTFAHQAALSIELIHFREKTSKVATEAERARIAGEIHDGLAQAFTGILMQARAARISTRHHQRDASPFLGRIESLAAGGLEEARRSLFALRSISVEHDGLVAALERLVGNLSIDGRMRCSFINLAPQLQSAPVVEDAIYRIVQEAVQNALKHADAQTVEVKFELIGNELRVTIEDDGVGISTDVVQRARESGGLRAMRDRAQRCGGTLLVELRPPRGTRVVVVFPSSKSAASDGK